MKSADSPNRYCRKKHGFSPLDIIGGSNYKVGADQVIAHCPVGPLFQPGGGIQSTLLFPTPSTKTTALPLPHSRYASPEKLTGRGRFSYTYKPKTERNNFNPGGRALHLPVQPPGADQQPVQHLSQPGGRAQLHQPGNEKTPEAHPQQPPAGKRYHQFSAECPPLCFGKQHHSGVVSKDDRTTRPIFQLMKNWAGSA